jgi:hypothetical protein
MTFKWSPEARAAARGPFSDADRTGDIVLDSLNAAVKAQPVVNFDQADSWRAALVDLCCALGDEIAAGFDESDQLFDARAKALTALSGTVVALPPCPKCGGAGTVILDRLVPTGHTQDEIDCPACNLWLDEREARP